MNPVQESDPDFLSKPSLEPTKQVPSQNRIRNWNCYLETGPGPLWLRSETVPFATLGVTVQLTGHFGKTVNRTINHVFLSFKTVTIIVSKKTVENRTAVDGFVTVNNREKYV